MVLVVITGTNSLLMVYMTVGWCRSHNGGVWSLQTSGSQMFSCGADCCIKAWDLDDLVRGCKTSIVAHSQRVSWHYLHYSSHLILFYLCTGFDCVQVFIYVVIA